MRALYVCAGVVVAAGVLAIACGSGDTTPADVAPTGVDGGGDARSTAPAALCVDGKPAVAYPPEPYEVGITGTLPNLGFEGEKGTRSVPAAAHGRTGAVTGANSGRR